MNMKSKEGAIRRILERNVEEVIERPHLEAALRSEKRLRVKLGIDPTGDRIHIGRAVALWKLREFQDMGHTIVLIIGDFTARIGDPSDKLEKRPMLAAAQVKKNLKTYLPQVGAIINLKKAEIRYNSEWLDALNFLETAELAESFSVNQMLRRRAFRDRLEKDIDISLREFMYPLMQGYDSVAVKADVELGGTDQLFNLLAGREIQKHYGQEPQDVMTTKMLSGLDGRKMSTSWGNVINIVDSPDEQFGKLMSMRDEVVPEYFELATDFSEEEAAAEIRALKNKGTNPRDIKMKLARAVVARYHGETAAKQATARWEKLFSKKEVAGDELPALALKSKNISAADAVFASGAAKSKSDAWRFVVQGGFGVNGETKKDPKEMIALRPGDIVRVGKKRYFRIAGKRSA